MRTKFLKRYCHMKRVVQLTLNRAAYSLHYFTELFILYITKPNFDEIDFCWFQCLKFSYSGSETAPRSIAITSFNSHNVYNFMPYFSQCLTAYSLYDTKYGK